MRRKEIKSRVVQFDKQTLLKEILCQPVKIITLHYRGIVSMSNEKRQYL